MGTLHTNGAAPTVDRMVNVFPSDKQSHVRTMLSTSLRGVVSQQLLQRADKQGCVAALEILVNTPAASPSYARPSSTQSSRNTMQDSGTVSALRTMRHRRSTVAGISADHGQGGYRRAMNKAKFEDLKGFRL